MSRYRYTIDILPGPTHGNHGGNSYQPPCIKAVICSCMLSSSSLTFISCCSPLWAVRSFRNDLWKQVHIMKSDSDGLVAKSKQNSSLCLSLSQWPTSVYPKTAQRSPSRLKVGGIVCGVVIWLHYLHLDAARLEPSWQWRLNNNNKTASISWLATPHDWYQDVFNTRNGLGKARGGWAWAFYSTLSSNHLILMLLHCLVNQPSIYINP